MKTRTILLWIFILVGLDQAIKIIIHTFFGDIRFEIIPSLLDFKPTFNAKHSYVNVLLNKNLGINVGLLPHVILYVTLGILITAYFSYFKKIIANNKKLIDASYIILFAGLICALIGNLIWQNGTLDYIFLIPFFVFDFKDAFVDIGVFLFLLYAVKNRKQMNEVKTKDVVLFVRSSLKIKRK